MRQAEDGQGLAGMNRFALEGENPLDDAVSGAETVIRECPGRSTTRPGIVTAQSKSPTRHLD